MRYFLPLFFLLNMVARSQPVSIHQEQADYFRQFSHYNEQQFDSLVERKTKTVSSQKLPPCNLDKVVFGWFPYWQGTTYNNFEWDKLSDLSYFSYEVDPATGNANSTHGWSTANVVTVAQQNGVRVNLCVTLFSSHATFFGSSSAQQTLISNLISLIQQRNANGVNIDFEGVPSSQKTALTNFMINLCNQMHSAIPGSQVSIALYSVDWNGVFDIASLNSYVDLFIIMGYDYYYGGSTTAGPNDPLYHFGTTYNYTLSKSVTYYLKQGVSPNKLILGLPYYGREYTTTSNTIPSSVLNPPNSVTRTFTTVMQNTSGNYTNANKYWEGDSFSPYWMFQSGGNWKQCFVDDAYSIRKRFDLVNQRGIGGIGIWALGYDDGYPDYWNAIKDKFTDCGSVPCADTLYDGGGPNKNYYDNENYSYTIAPTGASTVSLIFSSFDVEANYDTLWIYDGSTTNAPLIGSYTGTNSPGTVNSSGSTLTYRFKSDVSTNRPGWTATWNCITAPADNIPPTTTSSVSGNWQTQNFTTAFSDADNVSVAEKYYQVLDWNGAEWRANASHGFFNDNFNASLNAEWTNAGGNWAIASNYLNQPDETNGNTNVYASLNQNSSYAYLVHWQMRMGGSGTNRRAGLHFFSDNATLPNRGNGYFVYYRVDNQKAQIYKVVNDTFSLVSDVAYAFAANTFYDFKTSYNPSNGVINVYVNDVFVSSWTDTSPITSGNSISLRTGNCTADYNDIKVYRSRTAAETVSIGNSAAMVRYQNPNPTTPSCRIKSLVIDGAANWSAASTLNVNIDWTAPVAVAINDGAANDIDTTNLNTELTANWTASVDTHSAVAAYRYAIGTSPGSADIVNWISSGMNTSVTHTGLSLNYGTTYYFSVKAENGAGIESSAINSDGQLLLQPLPPPTASFSTANSTVCYGETINFQNTSTDADSFAWSFPGGIPSTSSASNPSVSYSSSGTYSATLIAYATANSTTDTLTQNITINVNPLPSASFTADTTTVYLPNATVDFINSSVDANAYGWNSGASTSSAPNPTFVYTDTGFYSVTLIASNGLCDNDTLVIVDYIHVLDTTVPYPAPVATFNFSSTTVCTGDYISFSNTSSDATSYEWTFAGGTPSASTNVNPSVIYDSSGTYTVVLIATGPGGSDTLTQSVSVTVNALPAADFESNDTLVYLPSGTVNFTNLSSDANSFLWNFGEGNSTSTLLNPSYTYSDTGYFTITLIAMNGNCPDDMLAITDYIHVMDTTSATPLPIAAFTVGAGFICEGDSTLFTNNSVNATSYEWIFSGGSPSVSNDANPSVMFTGSGSYLISLIATGAGGSDTLTQTVNITVNPLPTANFYGSPTTVYLPGATVNFINTSSDATSWVWDFAGSTSSVANPSFTYTDTGYFSVTLIASNGICINDTFTLINYIQVLDTTPATAPPLAGFTTSSTVICAGQAINFTNTSTGATSFQWLFPGGTPNTDTSANPSVFYNVQGTYNVILIASGNGGSDTLQQFISISITAAPVAGFSAVDTTVTLPNAFVAFTNNSSNATGYFWNFGDSTTSAAANPWHIYNDSGFFSVTLVAYNANCPGDTLTYVNYISVEGPVSVNDFAGVAENYSIFPNPALGKFYVMKDAGSTGILKVFSNTGQLIIEKRLRSGEDKILIDISGQPEGIYLLSISEPGRYFQNKIAVVR